MQEVNKRNDARNERKSEQGIEGEREGAREKSRSDIRSSRYNRKSLGRTGVVKGKGGGPTPIPLRDGKIVL